MVNRFRKVLYQPDTTLYGYNKKEYLPDLSVLDATMQSLQTDWDEANLTPSPKHLQPHYQFMVDEYVKPLTQLKEEAVQGFTEGNTSAGSRALRNMKRFIYNAKQPGGVYSELENAYNKYHKTVEDYRTKLKDAPGYYLDKTLNKIQIGEMRKGVLGSDVIGDPNIGQYINITKEVDDLLDGWQVAEDQIIRMDNKFIWKTKNREVTEEEIESATRSILDSPRFRQQLEMEREVLKDDFPQEYMQQHYQDVVTAEMNKNAAFIQKADAKTLVAEARRLGVPTTGDVKKNLLKFVQEKAAEQLETFDYENEIEKQFNKRYVDPLVKKHAFKSTIQDVDERQDYLVGLRHSYNMQMMEVIARPPEGVPFSGPAIEVDIEKAQKALDELNMEKASVNREAMDKVKKSGLGGIVPDINTLAKVIDAYDASGGDREQFAKHFKGYTPAQVDKLLGTLGATGQVGVFREYLETVGTLDRNHGEIQKSIAGVETAFDDTDEGKAFWKGKYNVYTKELKAQGIDSPEELKQMVDQGKKIMLTRTSAARGGVGGAYASVQTTDLSKDLIEARSKKAAEAAKTNKALKTMSPTGITGDPSSVPGRINSEMTKQLRSIGFGAYTGINGELPVFKDSDNKSYSVEDVNLETANAVVVSRFGKPMLLITGKVKKKGGKEVNVSGYAEPHNPDAQKTMAYSGLELYAYGLGTDGRPLMDEASTRERREGAIRFFYNSPTAKDLHQNRLRLITPDSAPEVVHPGVYVGGEYRVLPSNKIKGTEVKSFDIGGSQLKIYTSMTPSGDQVYHIAQINKGANGEAIMTSPAGANGTLETHKSFESALEKIAEIYTSYEVRNQGLYRNLSKEKVRLSKEGVEALQGITIQ